jgi:hypothetical protein
MRLKLPLLHTLSMSWIEKRDEVGQQTEEDTFEDAFQLKQLLNRQKL